MLSQHDCHSPGIAVRDNHLPGTKLKRVSFLAANQGHQRVMEFLVAPDCKKTHFPILSGTVIHAGAYAPSAFATPVYQEDRCDRLGAFVAS
jgi:hypothetical protein